jgi:glutaredoxin
MNCTECERLQAALEETKLEFDEFQNDSRELEAELEKEIADLKTRNNVLNRDLDDLKVVPLIENILNF